MRRVSDLTRIWILCAPPMAAKGSPGIDSAPVSLLLLGASSRDGALGGPYRELWRLEHGSVQAHEAPVLDELAAMGESGPPPGAAIRRDALEALDAIASRCAGRHVALVGSHALAGVAFRAAVRLGEDAPPLLGAIRNLVVDWPTRADPTLRPALIGIDQDWRAPGPPAVSARFPGGPGSAASART